MSSSFHSRVQDTPRLVAGAWMAALWAGAAYGVFLTASALHSRPGAELTGQWVGQPLFKAAMALLLTLAAAAHPLVRERRWLMAALVFSAAGDWLLAIGWWESSFVAGLAAFLIAHLCYLGALAPLVGPSYGRFGVVGLVVVVCLGLLVWFWPRMAREGLTLPVTIYIAVLCAMVCAALLAQLPTRWTALGAGCFALSDAMIGIGRFVLGDQSLAVPVWWSYAAAQLLITAGFFFGRRAAGDRLVRPV